MVSDANNPVGDNYENLKKLKFTKFFDFSYWLGLVVFIFVKAVPTGCARVPILVHMHHMKTQFSWASPTGTHGEYADEQLANLQKRIWLIEFLRLGLIIGCQGTILGLPEIKTPHEAVFFVCFLCLSVVRKSGGNKKTPPFHPFTSFYTAFGTVRKFVVIFYKLR